MAVIYFVIVYYFMFCLTEFTSCAEFITTPDETVLGEEGGSILLKWEYLSSTPVVYMKWFKTDEQNNPDKNIIIINSDSNNNIQDPIITAEYTTPTVRVFYNGSARIIISGLKLSDEGLIACSVDFQGGTTIFHKTNLVIGVKPTDISVSQIGPVNENTNLVLTCEILSKPQAPIKWYTFDNVEYTTEGRFQIQESIQSITNTKIRSQSKLIINGVQRSDAGDIFCKAKNGLGESSSSIKLTVYYRPIEAQLQFQYEPGLQGEANIAVCTANANPLPITYTIYLGDRIILTSTNGVFNFVPIQNYHQGTYKCIPSNFVGNGTEVSKELRVNVAPAFYETSPDTIIVNEDESINLICKLLSFPKADIGWSKRESGNSDNMNINTTITHENSSLVMTTTFVRFSRIKRSDYGIYNCDATNNYGNINKDFTLIVNYKPQIILHTLVQPNFFLNDSSTTTETCIAKGLPRPTIKWYRDNVEIQNGVKHEIINSIDTQFSSAAKSIITLNNVNKDDSGTLKCVGSNSAGDDSQSTNLNIYYKAEIHGQLNQVTYVNLGTSLSLSCVASGVDKPVISWYKNDIEIESGTGNYLIESNNVGSFSKSSILKINPVMNEDSNANYKCDAVNKKGSDERKTLVSVYFGPSITDYAPASVITFEGKENYEISCTVQANPKPVISWFKDGVLVNTLDSAQFLLDESIVTQTNIIVVMTSKLTLKNVVRKYFGNWTCAGENTIVGNIKSKSDKTTFLTVTYSPRFEFISSNPFRVNQTDTVIFICRVKASPKPFVWWELATGVESDFRFSSTQATISDETQFGSVEDRLTIRNIQRKDVGDYLCRTNNTIVTGVRVSRLIVQYPPTLQPDFTVNQYTVYERSISFIEVLIDSNPISSAVWYISRGNGTFYEKISANRIQSIQVAAVKDYEVKYKSRLLFTNGISRSDNSWYKVVVTNKLGKKEQKTYITIEWMPEPQTKLDPKQDAMLGESPSFICRFLSNPGSAIEWKKDGNPITKVGYRTTTLRYNSSLTLSQSVLTFLNVERMDKGNYTCKASNSIGESTQWKVLNVLYAPIVVESFQTVLVDPGENMILECGVDANPPVSKFQWRRYGQLLNINKQQYTQPNINHNSAGVYTCTPANILGNDTTITYNVSVRIPPVFTKPSTCIKKTDGTQSMLHCECEGTGYPLPLIYWSKYPSTSPISSNNLLNISVEPKTDGTYYCHLQNSKGDIRSSIRIANFVDYVSAWGIWGTCNSTCGAGFNERTRICNVAPCPEVLKEVQKCSTPCTGAQTGDDVNWMYALYALIPCVILLLVLSGVWFIRLNRRNNLSEQR